MEIVIEKPVKNGPVSIKQLRSAEGESVDKSRQTTPSGVGMYTEIQGSTSGS
ncbi:MAG: hypothetical protein ABGZ53_33460 [Fuerstiella sp.]